MVPRARLDLERNDKTKKRQGPWTPERLQAGLQDDDRGPLAAAFVRYLGTRSDLFSPLATHVLAATPLHACDAHADDLEAALARAWKRPAADVLGSLERAPRRVGPYDQWHEATLLDGTPVLLRLPRTDLVSRLDGDVSRLRASSARCQAGGAPSFLGETLDDFLLDPVGHDFQSDAAAFLALHNNGDSPFVVPRVHPELCGSNVWAVEPLAGSTLDAGQLPVEGTAVRLSLAWLRLALLDGQLVTELDAEDLRLLPDESLGMQAGRCVPLEEEVRATLLESASATAREDPDAACVTLLRLMVGGRKSVARHDLDLMVRFRQAEPLREDPAPGPYRGRRLGDLLGLQWRLAREAGYRPKPELVAWFRGISSLDRLLRRLAPGQDALDAGLADLRLLAGAVRARELLAPGRLTANVARYLPPLLDCAEHLDRLVAAEHDRPGVSGDNDDERSKDAWTVTVGLVALLFAVVWLSERVLPRALWSARWGAAAVAVLGGWLLWHVIRERRS